MLFWALALCQTSQGWELENSLNCTRLMIVEKRVETKMIWCLEMALTRLVIVKKQAETKIIWCVEMALYQICKCEEREEKLRWFNALRWPCTNLSKAEQGSGSLKICISPVCTSQPSSTLSLTQPFHTSQEKRKVADYIFVHQHCCCSSLYTTLFHYIFHSKAWRKNNETIVLNWSCFSKEYFYKPECSAIKEKCFASCH